MDKTTEKGRFKLADPSASFEVEVGKKTITGADTFTLEMTERVKKALRQRILIPIREDGGTPGGNYTAPFIPAGTEAKPVTPKVNKKPGGAGAASPETTEG